MARKKKQLLAKEPIKLRFKTLANGNRSIYLDIYHEGQRSYEFLKLYLIPETDAASKVQNTNTLQAANAIKAQRIIDIANGKANIKDITLKSKMKLCDWLQVYIMKRQDQSGIAHAMRLAKLLEKYDSHVIMQNADKAFVLGFQNWLANDYTMKNGKRLAQSTVRNLMGLLSAALNDAVKAEVISANPISKLDRNERIKEPESTREFLSIDEVKALISHECKYPIIKKAFLFSCFCGLRLSDVENLKWSDIHLDNGHYMVGIRMQKTKEPIYLPLSAEAIKWLPEPINAPHASDHVFSLHSRAWVQMIVPLWAKEAGITKHVTFHTSRHTFATMMLTLGADLYTTSKLLGHSDVSITQVYAKIVDQKKIDAVNLTDGLF